MSAPASTAIVKVDKRPYRKIAQEHWGLTTEQMKGMHVHHRVPQSKGGTNDPSNLYVCSPSFHAHVWHNGDGIVSWLDSARKGGKKGGKASAHKAKERYWTASKNGKGMGAISLKEKLEHRRKGGLAGKGVSKSSKGRKIPGMARPQEEHTCPHCQKIGKGVLMFRWHFDNCKHK